MIVNFMASVTLGAVAIAFAGCGKGTPSARLNSFSSGDAIISNYASFNGLGIDEHKIIASGDANLDSTLFALSGCHCGPEIAREIFERNSQNHRVLPQVLVPKIREQIQSNPLLAVLDTLPGGLGDLLASIAVNDEKMATQIRDGIKVNMAPAWTALGTSPFMETAPFRFDLFYTHSRDTTTLPTTFSVVQLASFWNLVFGAEDLWTVDQATGTAKGDVGAQALEVTRAFAEWAYILGIGSDGKPNGMGGLAFDLKTGLANFSTPTRPADITDDEARYISGNYVISYPQNQTALQTSKVKEQWYNSAQESSLQEQATVWRAAALAFNRMRSDKSKDAKALSTGEGAPLTAESRQLPLIWLPAMATLLNNYFIDKETQKIFESTSDKRAEATLDSLVALGFALQEWMLATKDLAGTDLPDDVKERLSGVGDRLKDPLRLTIVTILSRFVTIKKLDGADWLAFADEHLEDHQINAAIALLLSVEQSVLSGDLLKSRSKALFHWYVAQKLMTEASSTLSVSTTAWLLHNTRLMEQYPDSPSWIHTLGVHLDTAVGDYVP